MYDNSFEGVIHANDTATAGTTGTSEQTIMTYSLPANSLCNDKQSLRIRAYFLHAANTNNVTFKLYFGGSSISSGVLATSGETCELELFVSRRSSSTQLVWAKGSISTGPAILAPAYTAGSDDLTAAVTIKATVTGGTTGADGTVESMRIEFLQAP